MCSRWRISGGRVLDVGGGSGRVSYGVLRNHFRWVDMLEPVDYEDSFRDNLGSQAGTYYRQGL